MYNKSWQRHSDTDVAVDKILDAAGRAFADFGVSKAKMVDVARLAGCSRGTLYRYFPNQESLHYAFVHRATLRIGKRIAEDQSDAQSGSPAEMLTDRIVAGIAAVRQDPMLAIWFEPENMAVPITVSQNSEILRAVTRERSDPLDTPDHVRREIERRGEWLLRSIVSLLAMPGANDAAERTMIELYLVPILLAELPPLELDN